MNMKNNDRLIDLAISSKENKSLREAFLQECISANVDPEEILRKVEASKRESSRSLSRQERAATHALDPDE